MNERDAQLLAERIALARGGNTSAFDELLRQFHGRVWRFTLKWVRTPQDADDLTQEIFIVAWRRLPGFRGDSAFSTWLLGIALNIARNHHNRGPGRREVDLPEDDVLDLLLDTADDPSDIVDRRRQLVELDTAIRQLPPELRETLVMVRLEGLSLQEAATLQGVPLGTIKSRLNRAKERLLDSVEALSSRPQPRPSREPSDRAGDSPQNIELSRPPGGRSQP